MKKLALTLTIFACTLLQAQNSTIKPSKVTQTDTIIAPSISAEDPMNKAAWKRSGNNSSAQFSDTTLDNGRTVTYDATGNMVISDGAELQKTSRDGYPKAIGDYYTRNFPGERYKVLWAKDNNGDKTYYINRSTEVVWFDKDGNFKSKTKSTKK